VAATIRLEVSFLAPRASEVAEPAPTPAEPGRAPPLHATAQAAPAPESVEVLVRGEPLAPSAESLTRAEVRQLPGAFGDPFRAIEVLPGVTPIASGLPFFYVRGAPPGNVGYFLDGVRVPYLYHWGLGPSVVHPALVSRVDLYPGGYPARFGGFAGGIVSGETAEPRTDWHGEGNLRVFDVGAMTETGFADGRGTVLLGGRYSYSAAILSLIVRDLVLDYRDYQARVSYDLTPKDRVSVFSFGSYDLLGEQKADMLNILFGSEFYRLDLRYDRSFARSSTVRYAVTLGWAQTRIAEQRNASDRSIGSRVELRHPLDEQAVLRGGADVMLDAFGPSRLKYDDPNDPGVKQRNALFPQRNDVMLGAWADLVLDVTPAVEVTPGVRVNLFTSGNATALGVDPRLAARFKVTDKVRIVHAYGIAHQPPSYIALIPGLVPGTLRRGLQRSLQTSAGVEMDLPEEITASATLFQNAFFNMTDAIGATSGQIDINADQRSLGSAVGLELLVRRRLTKALGGFLAYTLSRSVRSIGRESFPSAYDRTHVVNAALAYNLGRAWRAGTRLMFYTGGPRSAPANGLLVPPRSGVVRNPAFYRLDLRLEKRWNIGRRGWLSAVLEVLNATLSRETLMSTDGSTQTIGPVTIPSIGVEGGF
jgi:hypothetical protein